MKKSERGYLIQSYVSMDMKEFAKDLGDGSEAEGVRRALEACRSGQMQARPPEWQFKVTARDQVPESLITNDQVDMAKLLQAAREMVKDGKVPSFPGIMVSASA